MLKHAAVNRQSIELGVMDHSSGTFWLSPGHRWPAPALWCTSVTGPWWRWSRPTPPPGQKPVCTCPSAASRTSPRERRETHTHTHKKAAAVNRKYSQSDIQFVPTLYMSVNVVLLRIEIWDEQKYLEGERGKRKKKKKPPPNKNPSRYTRSYQLLLGRSISPVVFLRLCVSLLLTAYVITNTHTHTHTWGLPVSLLGLSWYQNIYTNTRRY